MDGISLAASIIQIIDVSSRVVSKSIEIYQSTDHQLIEHREIDHITRALSGSARQIRKSIGDNRDPKSDTEIEQLRLAADCQKIATELLKALERLKNCGQHGRWSSLRQGLKVVWNEEKIANLETRLDRYRQQMIQYILETLRSDDRVSRDIYMYVIANRIIFRTQTEASAAQQSAIFQSIKKLQHGQSKLEVTQVEFGRQFLMEIKKHVGNADGERWRKDLLGAIHNRSRPRLQTTTQPRGKVDIRRRLIKSIEFQDMDGREIRITKASKETFKWIYESPTTDVLPWASFRAFLQREESGMYWITGKPGSGKSTLMKYLMKNDRTYDLLRRWAPEGVITGAFYFWNSGDSMQMSVEGLLRTLLAKSLQQLPKYVTKQVFPNRWEALTLFNEDDTPWTWHELSLALQELVLNVCHHRKFFFLIDGLDEFSGDHGLLTDFLLDLSTSASNLKICTASRPWVNFEDAFRNKPHLMLQDLTRRDIEYYVRSSFRESPAFMDLEQRDPRHAKGLMSAIALKAEGVFLWVELVVKSLLVGMTNGDGIRELRQRLEKIPSNLEDMFQKMLDSMDHSYRQHASHIFQIHRASKASLSLLSMAFADLEDEDEAFRTTLWPLEPFDLVSRCKHMKRKLSSRCKGLLEIESLPTFERDERGANSESTRYTSGFDPIINCKVQYLHRTVKDFIETPGTWDWLMAMSKESFDPCIALAKSYLLQLKTMDSAQIKVDGIWECALDCISYTKRSSVQNNGPVQMELMHELDRTAMALTQRYKSVERAEDNAYRPEEQQHWTNDRIPAIGTSFAYLMAMCGMSGFLETELANDDAELHNYGDNKTPLLFAVLEDYLVLNQYKAGADFITWPTFC
ncbi:P-loop containing protein [Fusarium mundagurra]|uniref:P-loop containing protein n=1 Tax=Fusarium mundagurra TaxID=1567541 RepID=A0A8H5YMS8_9HYPO|nr:P-loop containing protein [Fusarium mundagurra]